MTLFWWLTKDGDAGLLEFYERHYSAYKYKDGRKRTQCVGPGEVIALRTFDGDAYFVWRKFIDDAGEQGINCAIFRNESPYLSSELIRQADRVADFCWPGERHYTYVNAKKIKSSNPGYCFIMAGWRRTGRRTKSGLIVLEKLADKEVKMAEKLFWKDVKKNQSFWKHVQIKLVGSDDVCVCTICNEQTSLISKIRTRLCLVLEMARKHFYKHKLNILEN